MSDVLLVAGVMRVLRAFIIPLSRLVSSCIVRIPSVIC